jgi:hypothetical protein
VNGWQVIGIITGIIIAWTIGVLIVRDVRWEIRRRRK